MKKRVLRVAPPPASGISHSSPVDGTERPPLVPIPALIANAHWPLSPVGAWKSRSPDGARELSVGVTVAFGVPVATNVGCALGVVGPVQVAVSDARSKAAMRVMFRG